MKVKAARNPPKPVRLFHYMIGVFGLSTFLTATSIFLSFMGESQNTNYEQHLGDSALPRQHPHDSAKPLVELLRYANVSLTSREWESFPKWKEVVARFGQKPVIFGMETCEDYRQAVPLPIRHIAPAGAFNSGTNLLYELLKMNCVVNENTNTLSRTGIDWQVNWGKHQSPRFRFENVLKTYKNNSATLPIVMVRDPWSWFQSMCRQNYAALWFHVPGPEGHCPNLIPNEVEQKWFWKSRVEVKEYFDGDRHKVNNVMNKGGFALGNKTIPVTVRYKNEVAVHLSLAHFWKEWYQEYFDGDFPRLMIRLEDVVFHPYETLKAICDCAGGKFASKDDFILRGESTKDSDDLAHSQARKTDLAMAFLDHLRSNRTKGMTLDDAAFARGVLEDSIVRQYFGYNPPD